MKKFLKIILPLTLIISTIFTLISCGPANSDNSADGDTAKWFYGTKKPSDAIEAQIGDFYFEYDDCDVHVLTESGWEIAFNMKGENGKNGFNGKNGSAWYHGTEEPKRKDGNNGDFFINTKNLTVYTKKDGNWSVITRFTKNRFYDYNSDSDGELKILCIGNSYSIDTMHYAYQILQDLGIEKVTLGNLYIAGCPIGTHYNNLKEDKADYRFYYNDNGRWDQTENYTIKRALELEDWDFISFQQRSGYSGKPDYYVSLQPLADEVRKTCPDSVFLWNMTWAYQEGYKGLETNNYSSQTAMYNAIVDTVESVILPNQSFEFVSPVGTAIQNARSSYVGDSLTRDGFHLSYDLGKYIASLTSLKAMLGLDITGKLYSAAGVDKNEKRVAIESVTNATKDPFKITPSQYKDKP